MFFSWRILLMLTALGPFSKGAIRTWDAPVSLSDPALWMGGDLPCPGQRVVLPSSVVSSLPSGSSLTAGPELQLPSQQGMILLNHGSKIVLSSSDSSLSMDRCPPPPSPRGDAVFQPKGFGAWHDPANWRGGNAATPQLRRIPCRHDTAVFPRGEAFQLSLSHHHTDISRLSVNGRGVDSAGFRRMQGSRMGRLMFQVNTSLSVHGDRCSDPRGCLCGNDHIRNTVCSMESASCQGGGDDKRRHCSGGVRPTEHCCFDVCGAVVHVETYGEVDVKVSMLEAAAEAQTTAAASNKNGAGRRGFGQDAKDADNGASGDPGNVDFSVSRVGADSYEIVFVDREGDISNGIACARRAAGAIRAALGPKGAYVWTEESGTSPPSALRAAGKAIGGIIGLGVVVALLYFLGVAYLRKSGSGSYSSNAFLHGVLTSAARGGGGGGGEGFSFARFSNESGRVEMAQQQQQQQEEEEEEDPRVEVLDPVTMTMHSLETGVELGANRSFANPMFGSVGEPEVKESSGGLGKLVSIEEEKEEAEGKEQAATVEAGETVAEEVKDEQGTAPPDDKRVEIAEDSAVPPPLVDQDASVPPPLDEQQQEDEEKDNDEDKLISI